MVSIHIIMATTHHPVPERVDSRVKTLSGAKPCVYSGNVHPAVTEVGSVLLWFRASIWESCGQKAHRTV